MWQCINNMLFSLIVQAEPLKPLNRIVVGIHSDADLTALAHSGGDISTKSEPVVHEPTVNPDVKSPDGKSVPAHLPVESKVNIRDVFWMTTVMAAACGLGAVPFFFIEKLSKGWAALANAVACGVMIAASFDLLHEAESFGPAPLILGLVVGCVFIKQMQVRCSPTSTARCIQFALHTLTCIHSKLSSLLKGLEQSIEKTTSESTSSCEKSCSCSIQRVLLVCML